MATDEHGDEVTSEPTEDMTTAGERQPLLCGEPGYHKRHPYRLTEPRAVHGATFPAGLPVLCPGIYRIASCDDYEVHVGHYHDYTRNSVTETYWCNGIDRPLLRPVHGHMRRPGELDSNRVLGDIGGGKLTPMSFGPVDRSLFPGTEPQQVPSGNPSDPAAEALTAHIPAVPTHPVPEAVTDRLQDEFPELVDSDPAPYVDMSDLKFSQDAMPILGIRGRDGRSLLEFILLADGRVDVKFYDGDVTHAVKAFAYQLRRMYGSAG